jgi:hypothetical protein
LLGCGATNAIILWVLFAHKKMARLGKVRGRAMAMEAARLVTGRGLAGWLLAFLAANMTNARRNEPQPYYKLFLT